jgi:hypothetical protein
MDHEGLSTADLILDSFLWSTIVMVSPYPNSPVTSFFFSEPMEELFGCVHLIVRVVGLHLVISCQVSHLNSCFDLDGIEDYLIVIKAGPLAASTR